MRARITVVSAEGLSEGMVSMLSPLVEEFEVDQAQLISLRSISRSITLKKIQIDRNGYIEYPNPEGSPGIVRATVALKDVLVIAVERLLNILPLEIRHTQDTVVLIIR